MSSSRRRQHPNTTGSSSNRPGQPQPPTRSIPVSLGKPSLRLRLEAYYSLISPDVLSDDAGWRKRFEQIYAKYGGSVWGEASLAAKLAKKYGGTVRLLLTTSGPQADDGGDGPASASAEGGVSQHDEVWYELSPSELNSGVLSFTSSNFDPVAALSAQSSVVIGVNPYISDVPLLDDVSKFRRLLPPEDPQRLVLKPSKKRRIGINGKQDDTPFKSVPRIPGAFSALADRFEKGPFALLRSIHERRQRVRVLVRYVDCIRGTLTGYLLAFDKHMNLILRDVDEVYSSRVTKTAGVTKVQGKGMGERLDCIVDLVKKVSNLEMEVRRRTCLVDGNYMGGPGKDGVPLKRRHCHQLLVRGDNVVMVWRADDERSAWPRTEQTPSSLYSKKGHGDRTDPPGVASPGFLMDVLEWQRTMSRGEKSAR